MQHKSEILIVDDDVDLISNLKDILRAENYEVTVAHSGKAALSLKPRNSFDLAIIDIKLPDISGPELIQKLTERFPKGGEYIIITGYASLDTAVEVVGKRHVVAYLTKPLDMDNLLVLIRQVVERRRAEEALQESEERYHAVVNLGAEVGEAMVLLQDTDKITGLHVFVSDEWARITGYPKKKLLSMSMFDLVHPGYRDAALGRYKIRSSGGNLPGLYEVVIIKKGGTEVPVEVTGAYTVYKGKPAAVVFIRDITDRRKMEEQLVITDRLASLGELVAGIAHEMNNPLTSVIGYSDLLMKKDIPAEIKDDIELIHREANRTAKVVKNLLIFARKHSPEKLPTDINKTIQAVLELRAYEQKVRNIKVRTRFAPSLPEIVTDGFQLQQVFLNIIINAEHFMNEAHGGGTLTINTEQADDIVRASFTDDGPGIAPEDIGHIFDPFFTTKEVGKGTGLGLSVCHGIIDEHGGRIYAQSKFGNGATFTVELPIGNQNRRMKLTKSLPVNTKRIRSRPALISISRPNALG